MTMQIATVYIILVFAIALFVSERMRVDLVALFVLGILALTGLVTPEEALTGFSSPAVVTVWAVFILSAGLYRTGVASIIGRHVLRWAGNGEMKLLAVIMLTAGVMSAFMNNVGVAALMLPVVMDISRKTGRAPSKLLMPLAFGCLLGGLTTLIGTPPNILVSNALQEYGMKPFGMFDFTPIGLFLMLTGVLFMVLFGRLLLPHKNVSQEIGESRPMDLEDIYDFTERLFVMRLPPGAVLAGKTLAESRLGAILGVNILGIIRNGQMQLSPDPNTVLSPGDRLLSTGRPDALVKIHERGSLEVVGEPLSVESLVTTDIEVAQLGVPVDSNLIGKTIKEIDFRQRFGVNVLALRRDGVLTRARIHLKPLKPGDTLLIHGPTEQIDQLRETEYFLVSKAELAEITPLREQLLVARIPPDSNLVGKTLKESLLGEMLGLVVLGIVRGETTHLMPDANEELLAEDTLFIEGEKEDLLSLSGLQSLEVEREASIKLKDLEDEQVGLAEAVLSPHTTLIGKTLGEIHFREKYGLNVIAIWREGKAFRSNLKEIQLRFGDALLLFGDRGKLKVLGSDPDFLVLMEEAEEPPRREQAPAAIIIMTLVLLPVIFNLIPIYIAAVIGAATMVLTKCLTMEEAYRYIEWKAVFLIAGMLPLGIALERTGAAGLLASGMISLIGDSSPLAIVAGLFLMTALGAQVMPTAAVAVLMAPIALNAASDLGMSAHALLMTVAMSASASFMSPVAHPANVLIMGPGGYRFIDYIKVGLPLTIILLFIVVAILPVFWPLFP